MSNYTLHSDSTASVVLQLSPLSHTQTHNADKYTHYAEVQTGKIHFNYSLGKHL